MKVVSFSFFVPLLCAVAAKFVGGESEMGNLIVNQICRKKIVFCANFWIKLFIIVNI